MADEDDYKASVVFMTSDASAYMNGSVVSMDGGGFGKTFHRTYC